MSHMNLVNGLARHKSPVAQWLEHPTGVWKGMGSTFFLPQQLLNYYPFLATISSYIDIFLTFYQAQHLPSFLS